MQFFTQAQELFILKRIKPIPTFLLLLLITSFSANAQKHFIVRASKDSLNGYMPFYDTHEKHINIMLTIDPELKPAEYKFEYALQNKSSTNAMLDIYNGTFDIPQATFDYAVPINDTFIKSGNYKMIIRFQRKKTQELLQSETIAFQTLRKPNTYYRSTSGTSGLLITKRVQQEADAYIDISKTFVHKYDLDRIKKNIFALVPIAEKSEQSAMSGIAQSNDINILRRYFYNFWYSRNPQNPEAEWKAYAEKLNYCSRKFAYGALKGYQTDMGRIYLRFGPPNRSIKAGNERGTRPYEVWFYSELDQYTNLNILFSQISSLANERVILHSSDPGFYFNPNWADQLFTDPQERFNTNSHRVYDFFK